MGSLAERRIIELDCQITHYATIASIGASMIRLGFCTDICNKVGIRYRHVWFTPTLAQSPLPSGYFDYTPETRDQHITRLGEYNGYTPIANASGQPGISLPLHWNEDDLPIGVQLLGRYGDEATLIRLVAQLEEARPWSQRRPPVCAR